MGTGTGSNGIVGWVVDRKVPLTFFLALATQTVLGGIYVGSMQNTVERHEKVLEDLSRERIAEKLAQINGRIDTLLALAQQTDRQLDRLDTRVARMNDRP